MDEPRINYSRLLKNNFQNISKGAINFDELHKQLVEVSLINDAELFTSTEGILNFLIRRCHDIDTFKLICGAIWRSGHRPIAESLESRASEWLETARRANNGCVGCFVGGLIGDTIGTVLGTRFYRYFLLEETVNAYFRKVKQKTALQNLECSAITEVTIEFSKSLIRDLVHGKQYILQMMRSVNLKDEEKPNFLLIALPVGILTSRRKISKMVETVLDLLNGISENEGPLIMAGVIFNTVVIREVFRYKIVFHTTKEFTDQDRNGIVKNIEQSLTEVTDIVPERIFDHIVESIKKLKTVHEMIMQVEITTDEIRQKIGNTWKSYELPLFCFLMSFGQIPLNGIQMVTDQFQKAIQLSISIGGEVSLHASLTGAITGTLVGRSGISSELIGLCKNRPEMYIVAKDIVKIDEVPFDIMGAEEIYRQAQEGSIKCDYELCNRKWPFQTSTPSISTATGKSNEHSRYFPTETELITSLSVAGFAESNDYCIHKLSLRAGDLANKEFATSRDINPENIKLCCSYLYKRNWRLLASWKKEEAGCPTFSSSSFYNVQALQLVILLTNKEFGDGLPGYVLDWLTTCAYSFTKRILFTYGKISRSVTISGYGIGGFLAQIVTAEIERPGSLDEKKYKIELTGLNLVETSHLIIRSSDVKGTHLHCVSFNSPPYTEILTKLSVSNKMNKVSDLDIHVYLERLGNIDGQIGVIYLLRSKDLDLSTLNSSLEFYLTYENGGKRNNDNRNIVRYVDGKMEKNWISMIPIYVFNMEERKALSALMEDRNKFHIQFEKNIGKFEFINKDFIVHEDSHTINIGQLVNEVHAPNLKLQFLDKFINGMKIELKELTNNYEQVATMCEKLDEIRIPKVSNSNCEGPSRALVLLLYNFADKSSVNFKADVAKYLMHQLLNLGYFVITFSDLHGIFQLVREDTSEDKVIPILFDIASYNKPIEYQKYESIAPGSKTPILEDILSNLPTPCHLINFDVEDFTYLIPALGKPYEEVQLEVLPNEFQYGCQKLLREMCKDNSHGKVFNIIVLDPDKIKWQKKASNFLRNSPLGTLLRGKQNVVRRLPRLSINFPNETVHKLIRALRKVHEDNWKEFQRELEKAKNDHMSMEKQDIPIELKKANNEAIKKVRPCLDKTKQTYSKCEMPDYDSQESTFQILDLKSPAAKEAEVLQNEQIGLYDIGLELRITNIEARFYFHGLKEQIRILKEHYGKRT